jgi:hypothetical protein
VHRIKADDLHKDLLAEKDKPLYSTNGRRKLEKKSV